MKVLDLPVTLPGDAEASPRLRFYLAEPVDIWQGVLVGHAGWNGLGLLPCRPGRSMAEAMQAWLERFPQPVQPRRRPRRQAPAAGDAVPEPDPDPAADA